MVRWADCAHVVVRRYVLRSMGEDRHAYRKRGGFGIECGFPLVEQVVSFDSGYLDALQGTT